MPDSTEMVVIECTEETAAELRAEIDRLPQGRSRSSQQHNLDGTVATWTVFATLAVQALPHLLTFINARLGLRRVKKIKVGNVEIENPTEEDLARLREFFPRYAQEEEKQGEKGKEDEEKEGSDG